MINNNTQEAYCSFEVSKLLKEKGFLILKEDEHAKFYHENFKTCTTYHRDLWEKYGKNEYKDKPMVQKVTHALAIEWIRVNFGYYCFSDPVFDFSSWTPRIFNNKGDGDLYKGVYEYNSPQEATEAALLFTLQNLIP